MGGGGGRREQQLPVFVSIFFITVRINHHSHFGKSTLSRKPSNVVDMPRSNDLVRACWQRMMREEEMALLGRCHGESPRARLLLMGHNVHSAKSSNYTTQGNYQTLASTICKR